MNQENENSDTAVETQDFEERSIDPKFEEITRSSLLISAFSHLDPETFIFTNRPYLLGGEGLIEDSKARLDIETAYGQLNLPDLFKQFDFVLNVASYLPFKIKEDLVITPNIYSVKSMHGDTFSVILLVTPWSDLNISSLVNELDVLVTDYSGTLQRVKHQVKEESLSNLEGDKQLDVATDLLFQKIYFEIFLERRLIGGVEIPRKPSNLFAVVFQEGKIEKSYVCLNKECGYHYQESDVGEDLLCSNCGNKLSIAPPLFTVENISLAFPQDLLDKEKNGEKYISPIDCYYLCQASNLPPELRLVTFRIDQDIFQWLIPFPSKAFFQYRDSDDNLALYSQWRRYERGSDPESEGKVIIVTGIADSRIEGGDTVPQIMNRVFTRNLNEAVKKKWDRPTMVKKSILSSWHLSKWVKMKGEVTPEELVQWQNLELEEIPKD
ncbi:MAG: hypothetical protein ACFFBD_02725 [Candidatus Hodarchaeota archaeon]